jgi:hypothetical protein
MHPLPLGKNHAYQPETQLSFLVERLMLVNLYSNPTEIAKFTSVEVVNGA